MQNMNRKTQKHKVCVRSSMAIKHFGASCENAKHFIAMAVLNKPCYCSPTRLALGVLTFPEELVPGVRTPRFRDEGAERRCSAPLSAEGSARFRNGFLKDFPYGKVPQGSARFRKVPLGC